MINFHDVNLPHFLAIHVEGGPSFATTSAITSSGREIRKADRTNAIQQYTIKSCKLSHKQFDEFNAFFRARLGAQYAFRLRDYADYMIKNQTIATGDDHSTEFEIYKVYTDKTYAYQRRIRKLVLDDLILEMDSVKVSHTMLNPNTGVVTLDSALSMGQSLVLKHAIFDVPVRFKCDNFKYSIHIDGSILLDPLELVEVL